MAKLGSIKFKGKSGTQYAFSVYPLETKIRQGFSGVYVITRRKEGSGGRFVHKRIRTGEGDNLRATVAPDGAASADANCICVHKEADAAQRQMIEHDLAAR